MQCVPAFWLSGCNLFIKFAIFTDNVDGFPNLNAFEHAPLQLNSPHHPTIPLCI